MTPRPRLKPRLNGPEVKRMTVCIGCLAAKRRAIVCVADKALSYGEYTQWDSESSKILTLNPENGSTVMIAGDEEPISRVLSQLETVKDSIGGRPRQQTMALLEDQYNAAFQQLLERSLLRPRLLNKQEYKRALTAPGDNHLIRGLANEVAAFSINCAVMVCGFDDQKKPFILGLSSPGVATDYSLTGFHAIGVGYEKAIARILISEHSREHDIERVIYDAFDAKANAELAVGVGPKWDATIIFGGRLGSDDVPLEIKDLIRQIWKRNISPFDEEENTLGDWKARLSSYSVSLLERKLGKPKSDSGS